MNPRQLVIGGSSIILGAVLSGANPSIAQQPPPLFELREIHAFGSSDTTADAAPRVFENLASGAVRGSLVFVLDRGAGYVVRLRVDERGFISDARRSLGHGRLVVGRLLRPACLALTRAGAVVVGEADGVVTTFDDALNPLSRGTLPAVHGLSGLAPASEETWVGLVSGVDGDALLKLTRQGADTLTSQEAWLGSDERMISDSSGLHSPAFLADLSDSSVLIGSSHRPVIARLSKSGELLWTTTITVPAIPDLMPPDAPEGLRNASFRVSSAVSLSEEKILATLFRPGRPQTVVALLTADGGVVSQVIAPFPVWFLGVAESKFLIAARIRDRQEVVSYALP